MKLGAKTRYGTRAMLGLAPSHENVMARSGEIAARQQISRKYLEALLVSLRSAGLARTVRGAWGGLGLPRALDQINLKDG